MCSTRFKSPPLLGCLVVHLNSSSPARPVLKLLEHRADGLDEIRRGHGAAATREGGGAEAAREQAAGVRGEEWCRGLALSAREGPALCSFGLLRPTEQRGDATCQHVALSAAALERAWLGLWSVVSVRIRDRVRVRVGVRVRVRVRVRVTQLERACLLHTQPAVSVAQQVDRAFSHHRGAAERLGSGGGLVRGQGQGQG